MTEAGGTPAGRSRPPPGVEALDHTADVGIEVRAPTLAALFDRAAAGMMAALYGSLAEDDGADTAAVAEGSALEAGAGRGDAGPAPAEAVDAVAEREIALDADDVSDLLALWLRELLYLHEADGFAYRSAEFDALDRRRLRARVRGGRVAADPIRELKGVTYHGLEVAPTSDDGWRARVIFDV